MAWREAPQRLVARCVLSPFCFCSAKTCEMDRTMCAMSSLDAEALDGVAIFFSVSVDVDFLAHRLGILQPWRKTGLAAFRASSAAGRRHRRVALRVTHAILERAEHGRERFPNLRAHENLR